MTKYLNVFWNIKNYTIMMSVKDDISEALDDDTRYDFDDRGLKDLYYIGYQDSYVCVVQGEKVLHELRSSAEESISLKFDEYELVSCGYLAGDYLSIK